MNDALQTLLGSELYQELTRRTMKDEKWAEYFLLLNACLEIVKQAPESPESCDTADVEGLLSAGLERLAIAVCQILPDGMREFAEYLPVNATAGLP